MPAGNYVIYGWFSLRTIPGVITIPGLHTGGKALLQLLLDCCSWYVIDDNLKRKIKSRTVYTCRLFLLNQAFQYTRTWSSVYEHLHPLSFCKIATQSNNVSKFS